ncbi:hypothetical protein EVAR_4165_1 [Eumeta japonica]|uniref:Uncharacterized protein n=1 Tax=Eumeta variegata TaxID=151549 RepID=A0A4C1TGZ8_EUMVA|nr:hypothetical protein EVAR_4165_1 [Eumeta japonica]
MGKFIGAAPRTTRPALGGRGSTSTPLLADSAAALCHYYSAVCGDKLGASNASATEAVGVDRRRLRTPARVIYEYMTGTII